MKDYLAGIFVGLVFLLALGLVGRDDYEQEMDQERRYCEMVMRGDLSNYNNIRCWEKYDGADDTSSVRFLLE